MLRRRASGRLRFKRPRRGRHCRTRRQRHELHPRPRPGHLQLAQHRLRRRSGRIVALAQREFRQIFPQPGWVEHDPDEIWATQLAAAQEALAKAGLKAARHRRHRHHQPARDDVGVEPPHRPAGPQRHRLAGPAHRAAVRAAARRRACRADDPAHDRAASSTPTSPAPSCAGCSTTCTARTSAAPSGELAFGTVDSWLLWKLTGGARARHRREQRLAHDAVQHPPQRRGTTSC